MRKRDELADPRSCWNKAKDDEFVFVLLGRDRAVMATIIAWCNERVRLALNTDGDTQISEALECANKMIEHDQKGPPCSDPS